MSKIFDALKKVQAEAMGKRTLAAPQDEHPAVEEKETPRRTGSFAAEMVSMRYTLDAKVGRAHKAITFTCSVPEEGSSTVSRMFAEILVEDPAVKVILVDANMHNPTIHKEFEVEAPGGLTDILLGSRELNDCVRNTQVPRLNVVPSGDPINGPIQAFASENMKRLISDLLTIYDYVIFDAPAVLVHPEATVLSSQTDGVVFVVEAVRTKKEVIKKAVDAIRNAGGQVLGIVLNKNKHYIPEFIYRRV